MKNPAERCPLAVPGLDGGGTFVDFHGVRIFHTARGQDAN